MSKKIILQNVRGSFVHLTAKNTNSNFEPYKYEITVLIKKDDPQVDKLKRLIDAELKDVMAKLKTKKPLRTPLKDGDDETNDPRPEYAGHYYMRVSNKEKTGIVNKSGEPADEDNITDYCYSGSYFHVSTAIAGYVSGSGGVGAFLNGVMLHRKGDRFDSRTTAKQDFAEFANSELDEDDDFDIPF